MVDCSRIFLGSRGIERWASAKQGIGQTGHRPNRASGIAELQSS
ncbi:MULTISPECIES: hypothetical protein [unclassified Microcoleus]